VGVEGFGALDGDFTEVLVEFFEDGFGESGADVANCFVGVGGRIIASEKEGAVYGGAFSFPEVGS
jgi:hypothetical protein